MAISCRRATPLPGYEGPYGDAVIFASDERRRLFWALKGSLEESVYVMRDSYSPDQLENYHQVSPGGDGWHPISEKPVTSPPVSNIFVRVHELDEWGDDWEELHMEVLDDRVFQDNNGDVTADSRDEEGNSNLLIRCCGSKRSPEVGTEIEVRASNKPFVTIHDYVTAVHPWLMGQIQNIRLAMNVASWSTEHEPLPETIDIAVCNLSGEALSLDELESWKAYIKACGSCGSSANELSVRVMRAPD